jgi:predicted AlkP superfamily pyrophosphatase or phosphodiesterase
MNSMLPAPPKTLGMLGDVLISALQSVSGEKNSLGLAKKRSVCVILIDGLGSTNLKDAGAHAGFLNSKPSIPASCFFPATTSTSIVSFATGKPPWETGFIGYQIFDRAAGVRRNLLNGWESSEDAKAFQSLQTVSEKAVDLSIEFHTVAPSAYRDSGFTAATMRGSEFHGTKSIEERFDKAKALLADGKEKIVYLYIPELDQIAHAQGWKSQAWLNQLEDVDGYIAKLTSDLRKTSGIIVTADHGIVDVPHSSHIYLDEYLNQDELLDVGGDTRALFIYLKNQEAIEATLVQLEADLGDSCYLVNPRMLIEAGYWQENRDPHLVPDIVVMAKKEFALYHRGFAKKKSLEMIGHHGSISQQEMSIPLIVLGF